MRYEISDKSFIIGELAMRSMLYEVSCYPSPGLVSPFCSGAHSDMDFFTFMRSTPALYQTMILCAQVGLNEKNGENILAQLRGIGLAGEVRMFKVTNQINTQKGQIFLHGILCAVAGHLLSKNNTLAAIGLCHETARICKDLTKNDFNNLNEKVCLTRGESLFIKHGIAGIRGEVEAGLPSVEKFGLPSLYEAREAGLKENDVVVHVLLSILRNCDDSNIAGKHSIEISNEIKKHAEKIMNLGGMLTEAGRKEVKSLNSNLIKRGISPGGSADLTAATLFIDFLSFEFKQTEKRL